MKKLLTFGLSLFTVCVFIASGCSKKQQIDATPSPVPATPLPTLIPTEVPSPKRTEEPSPTPFDIWSYSRPKGSSITDEGSGYNVEIPSLGNQVSDTPLFDENYYLILPYGQGHHYILDCYGKLVNTFHSPLYRFYGIYKKDAMCMNYSLKDMAFIENESTELNESSEGLYSFLKFDYPENGGGRINVLCLRDWRDHVSLDYALPAPIDYYSCYGALRLNGNYVLLPFTPYCGEPDSNPLNCDPFVIDKNGKVLRTLDRDDFDGLMCMLGESYFLKKASRSDEIYEWDVIDERGRILLSNVRAVGIEPFTVGFEDDDTYFRRTDYLLCSDGYFYDSKLNKLAKYCGDDPATVERYGNYLDGYPYRAMGKTLNSVSSPEYNGIPAVHTYENGMQYVQTEYGNYCLSVPDSRFVGVGRHMGWFRTGSGDDIEDIFVNLDTGKVIPYSGDVSYRRIADCFVYREENPDVFAYESTSYDILDCHGVEHHFVGNIIAVTPFEMVILCRGAYVGLADLDGNWIFRVLRESIANDTQISYY